MTPTILRERHALAIAKTLMRDFLAAAELGSSLTDVDQVDLLDRITHAILNGVPTDGVPK